MAELSYSSLHLKSHGIYERIQKGINLGGGVEILPEMPTVKEVRKFSGTTPFRPA